MDKTNSFGMDRNEILFYLAKLNDKLSLIDETGEILLFGGAAMCLSFGSRRYTRDIDAVFEPKSSMYDLIHEIAQEEGIPEDWLNDGVKGWLYEQPEKVPVAVMSHLSVYSASAAYILAMKCHAARIGGSDLEDAKILAAYLGLADRNEILDLVERYIPRKYLGVKTVAFVEALLDG